MSILSKRFKSAMNIILLSLINLMVFYNYWIGRSTPPWDFLGGGQVEQFRFYKDGSFFSPTSWYPYGWFGIPEYQMLQDGAWFLPVAFVSEFLSWNPQNAARVQAFLILLGSIGAYYLAKNYVKDSRIALLSGILYSFIPAFYSNAQHYGVVRSAALFPWVLYIVNSNFLLRKRFSILIGSWIIFQTIVGSYPGNLISIFYTTLVYAIFIFVKLEENRIIYLFKLIVMSFSGILMGLLRYLPVLTNLNSFPNNAGNQAGVSLDNLVYLLFPYATSNLPWGDPSLRSIYIGPLVFVLLFFMSRNVQKFTIWIILLFISIIMMMPNQINDLMRDFIPFSNFSRFAITDWRNTFNLSVIMITIIILENIKNKKIFMSRIRIYLIVTVLVYMIYLGIIYNFSINKIVFYLLPTFFITIFVKFLNNLNIKVLILIITCFNFLFYLDNNLSWLTTVKEQNFNIYKKNYSDIKETVIYPMKKRTKRYFLIEPPLTSDQYRSDQRYNRFWLTGGFGALGYHNIKDIPEYRSLFNRLEIANDPIIKFLSLEGKQLTLDKNHELKFILTSCLNSNNCNSLKGTKVNQLEFNKQSETFHIFSKTSFLLVQNEMYSSVWSGKICKVNDGCTTVKSFPSLDSLRTWSLPEGEYTFTTQAITPFNQQRWILFTIGLLIPIIDLTLRLFYSRQSGIKNKNVS